MKKYIIMGLLFSTLFNIGCQESNTSEVLEINAFKLGIEKEENILLIDVRTPKEYNEGFIKGALNIDFLNTKTFNNKIQELDKNKELYIYCRSGGRSQKAAKIMSKMGFEKVYDLKGGYLNWTKKIAK